MTSNRPLTMSGPAVPGSSTVKPMNRTRPFSRSSCRASRTPPLRMWSTSSRSSTMEPDGVDAVASEPRPSTGSGRGEPVEPREGGLNAAGHTARALARSVFPTQRHKGPDPKGEQVTAVEQVSLFTCSPDHLFPCSARRSRAGTRPESSASKSLVLPVRVRGEAQGADYGAVLMATTSLSRTSGSSDSKTVRGWRPWRPWPRGTSPPSWRGSGWPDRWPGSDPCGPFGSPAPACPGRER